MSTIDAQRRLLLERKAIEELRSRIGREAYMSVLQVAKHRGVSRGKIESLPVEVLPYADHGAGRYAQRRYHPADVMALDAVMRAWKAAQDRNEAEAFLRARREELEARDAVALEAARSMTDRLAGAA